MINHEKNDEKWMDVSLFPSIHFIKAGWFRKVLGRKSLDMFEVIFFEIVPLTW